MAAGFQINLGPVKVSCLDVDKLLLSKWHLMVIGKREIYCLLILLWFGFVCLVQTTQFVVQGLLSQYFVPFLGLQRRSALVTKHSLKCSVQSREVEMC